MDRFEAMTIFMAVATKGGFTAAARSLKIPLPTVSRKVNELEAHLGTRLLNRSTRHVALTDAGAEYLAGCKRILGELSETERRAAREHVAPRGELVISAPIVFGRLHVVPVICSFLKQHPQINIQLVLSDRNIQLGDENIDAAVRIGRLPDSSLKAVQVGQVRQIICGSPSYLSAAGIPKTPGDLHDHALILLDVLSTGASWSFGGKRKATVAIHPRLSVNTAEAAMDAAVSGLGLTRVLSYQAADALKDGRLRRVLSEFEPPPLPVNIVFSGQAALPLKTRKLIDYAATEIKRRVPQQ